MDKKGILEKAKKENKNADERYYYLHRRGTQLAMGVGLVICCIGTCVDLIINSKFTLLGYFMMITQMAMQGTLHVFLAIKNKQFGEIICAVFAIIALILFVICLILYLLGVV